MWYTKFKRLNGFMIGIFLVTVGILGGVTYAATQGSSISREMTSMFFYLGDHGTNQRSGSSFGAGGMMGGALGSVWTPSKVSALVKQSEKGVTLNKTTNTITYHSRHVLLVPLAAPAALHVSGMQWEIDGLINPTVVIPKGAHVTVDLVNADQGYMHGFEITTAEPPFIRMAMGQGSIAFARAFVMPIPPETTQGQYHRSTQFAASKAGTYYYICPVPGHAAAGMAGRFIVK